MAEAGRSIAERILDRLFEYQEIRDGCEGDSGQGDVYLKRYFILRNNDADRSGGIRNAPTHSLTRRRDGNGFQIYLHCIKRSDADRELHDHPWRFVSLILWRGYVEETGCIYEHDECADLSRKWPGMVLVRDTSWRHRVLIPWRKPAWTLVITSGKKRTWGFWRDGAFVPWRQFIAKKCADRDERGAA